MFVGVSGILTDDEQGFDGRIHIVGEHEGIEHAEIALGDGVLAGLLDSAEDAEGAVAGFDDGDGNNGGSEKGLAFS